MLISSPSSLPPNQELRRLTELLHSLEKACARIDQQLRRLEQMPNHSGTGAVGSPEKQPWSLFEAAPEVATPAGLSRARPVLRIPPQPQPQLSPELEKSTLDSLNVALGEAFDQVLRRSAV